jgi:hypothetical protein
MPDLAPDSTLVLAQWHFAGRGHQFTTPSGPLDPPPRRSARWLATGGGG